MGKSISTVDCSAYQGRLAVHFSHGSNANCFLGGWLEALLREKYPQSEITFKNRNNEPISREKLYTEMGKGDVENSIVLIDGQLIGAIYSVVNDQFRAKAARNFMEEIKDRCR